MSLKMMLRIIIFFLYSIICFGSCCNQEAKMVKTTLKLAGENRRELEKVLEHYSADPADSLKLKAARFLIANMPGHYTLDCPELDSIRKDTTYSYYERKVLDICAGSYPDICYIAERKEDVKYLTSDYLIRHIEASFDLLENYSWNRDIPFDLFLEYILPYRLENEQIDLWRDSLHINPESVANLNNNDDLKYDISRGFWKLSFLEPVKKLELNSPLKLFGEYITHDCRNIYLAQEFRLRSLGIPAVLDYLPCYPNRNGYHYWSRVVSSFRRKTQIDGAPDSKAAKVYRRTFSHQLDLKPGKHEYVPDYFRDPFNKDVTDLYFNTTDVLVNARDKLPGNLRYAYLCVFNNLAWQPIAIGELKGKAVEYKNMGKDIVYLPIYYQGKTRRDLNYPFVLAMNGKVHKLIPDTNKQTNLRLIRKYPFGERLYFDNSLNGASMEASVNPDFRNVDTIFNFRMAARHYIDESISVTQKYRYWRVANANAVNNIAELVFWDQDGQILKGQSEEGAIKSIDGDPLTCATYGTKEITVDFGKPVSIKRIVCLPRSDGNGIYPGDEYELFFYSKDGWSSLGRKMATDYFIDYEDVPANALYWLRNRTCGIEERIFTSDKGEIRFW